MLYYVDTNDCRDDCWQVGLADRLTLAADDLATNTFTYLLDGSLESASNVGTPDMPEITLTYNYETPNALYLNNLHTVTDDWGGVTTYGFSENGRLDRPCNCHQRWARWPRRRQSWLRLFQACRQGVVITICLMCDDRIRTVNGKLASGANSPRRQHWQQKNPDGSRRLGSRLTFGSRPSLR